MHFEVLLGIAVLARLGQGPSAGNVAIFCDFPMISDVFLKVLVLLIT